MDSPRLLLVDDDPDLGVVVRILARRCGYTLAHRLDAESAWASLDAERPDLIFLDVNLPGTNGLEFLVRLRASPDHARQAVALFVQPALTHDIAVGWAAGADYHVSKDLVTRPDAWKRRLDEIISHLHGRASGSSIFIKRNEIPTEGSETAPLLLRFPRWSSMSQELLLAVAARAAATGPLTAEIIVAWMEDRLAPSALTGARAELVGDCLFSLIDQVGCLFGRDACETIRKELQTNSRGMDEQFQKA